MPLGPGCPSVSVLLHICSGTWLVHVRGRTCATARLLQPRGGMFEHRHRTSRNETRGQDSRLNFRNPLAGPAGFDPLGRQDIALGYQSRNRTNTALIRHECWRRARASASGVSCKLGRTFSLGLGPPPAGHRSHVSTTGDDANQQTWKPALALAEFVNLHPGRLAARTFRSPLHLVKHTVSRSPPNTQATSELLSRPFLLPCICMGECS